MTEVEWSGSVIPQKMREHLEETGGGSERKLRLFAVACCRRVDRWFVAPVQHTALDILDRYAEGLVFKAELRAVSNSVELFDEAEGYSDAQYNAASALIQALCDDPPGVDQPTYYHRLYDTIMHTVDTVGDGAAEEKKTGGSLPAQTAERRTLAYLIRCVFGNPFRPVAVEASWLTSDVFALASQMYESRDFSPMPILGDAPQDAGCDNSDILNHCRQPSEHVRGCWVVDLILGKI